MHTCRGSYLCIISNHIVCNSAYWLDLSVLFSDQSTSVLGWTTSAVHSGTGSWLDPSLYLESAGGHSIFLCKDQWSSPISVLLDEFLGQNCSQFCYQERPTVGSMSPNTWERVPVTLHPWDRLFTSKPTLCPMFLTGRAVYTAAVFQSGEYQLLALFYNCD